MRTPPDTRSISRQRAIGHRDQFHVMERCCSPDWLDQTINRRPQQLQPPFQHPCTFNTVGKPSNRRRSDNSHYHSSSSRNNRPPPLPPSQLLQLPRPPLHDRDNNHPAKQHRDKQRHDKRPHDMPRPDRLRHGRQQHRHGRSPRERLRREHGHLHGKRRHRREQRSHQERGGCQSSESITQHRYSPFYNCMNGWPANPRRLCGPAIHSDLSSSKRDGPAFRSSAPSRLFGTLRFVTLT
jgi:hypothetical protein